MCTGMPQWRQAHGNELNLYPGKFLSWDEHANLPISGHQVISMYGGKHDLLEGNHRLRLTGCQILQTQIYSLN